VVVVGVVACDSGKKSPATSAGSAAPGSGVTAAVADAAVVVIPIDAPPQPGDVPALALADADAAVIEASSKLNTAGFGFHGKKQYTEAIAKYREALAADPGNLLARYNLASVFALRGDTKTALELLAQFKRPDCRACAGILLHAAKDRDWKALHADPTFKDITGGITVEKMNMKKVFKQVIAAVRTGKPDGLEPFVHPRSPIDISEASYGQGDGKIATLHGWKAFTGWLKPTKLDSPNDDEYTECDAKCCHWGQRGDSSNVIDSVCFAGPGGVLFISSIFFDGGAI